MGTLHRFAINPSLRAFLTPDKDAYIVILIVHLPADELRLNLFRNIAVFNLFSKVCDRCDDDATGKRRFV